MPVNKIKRGYRATCPKCPYKATRVTQQEARMALSLHYLEHRNFPRA